MHTVVFIVCTNRKINTNLQSQVAIYIVNFQFMFTMYY